MSWLAQLEKDLKGKPLSSLDWEVEPGISLKPFYTRGDSVPPTLPIPNESAGGNAWRICERLDATEAAAANAQALDALSSGADMLWLDLPKGASGGHLERLLREIHLSYIFTVFHTEDVTGIATLLPDQSEPFEGIFVPREGNAALWSDGRPGIFLDGRHLGAQAPSVQLGTLLAAARKSIQTWQGEGRAENLPESTLVAFSVGDHYLVEIGKLRAFKALWLRLMREAGLPERLPHLHVETTNAHEDPHTNMVAAATQALSAVTAGTHSLSVRPANNGSDAFHRRIARNVQHLLQLESGLDRVADPAAGSYFLEKLTEELAQRAWTGAQG